MNREPTCREIATDYALWQEYADPHAEGTEAEFDAMTVQEKIDLLHRMSPGDCNCAEDESE